MHLFQNKTFARWFIILSSVTIVGLIVWNISMFYNRIKAEERNKMLIWSSAMKSLNQANLKGDDITLELDIITNNETIPIIILSSTQKSTLDEILEDRMNSAELFEDFLDDVQTENIPEEVKENALLFYEFLKKIEVENVPIDMNLGGGDKQTIYYGNSKILTKLKYYPLILFLIVAMFVGLLYFFYDTSRTSEQNKLWVGMAKETAHQIGTPLSSLFGWLEILKAEGVNQDYIDEIEKDIDRLKTITERFSKVGSQLKLEKTDITQATKNSYEYLKSRSSKLIEFEINLPDEPIYVLLNEPLFSWTIENLTKNAIDAMKGKGKLEMELARSGNWIKILISDSGKGIPLKNFKKVFEPGFSTKKRGWGLGLSLAKRIVEDYHKGKISIVYSEISKGTTFEIRLRKWEE